MKVLGFFAMALAGPASALDEEKQVLATQKARRALAIALRDGARPGNHAGSWVTIVRRVMRDNAIALYRLDGRP